MLGQWDGNDLDRDVMSSDEGSTEYEDVEDVLDQVFEGVLGLTLDEWVVHSWMIYPIPMGI